MTESRGVTVVGAGWLGTALASDFGVRAIPQRDLPRRIDELAGTVVLASGVNRLDPAAERARAQSSRELEDVRAIIDHCASASLRVLALGSSDVCGLAPVIRGDTPLDPASRYGELKAQRECLLVGARGAGLDVTVLRLAPVHGPGKRQTARLVAMAHRRLLPLPNGGHHSIGFVTLHDVVGAVRRALDQKMPPVIAVGAGPTELVGLLRAIGDADTNNRLLVPLPLPRSAAMRMARSGSPQMAWLGRLSLERCVQMEVPMEALDLQAAAQYLRASTVGGRIQPHSHPREDRS